MSDLVVTQAWPGASVPLLHVADGVATITFNRPAHRNRLQDEDLATLLEHVEALRSDKTVRVLVLTARTVPPSRVFSAGYHLGAFEEGAAAEGFERVPDALARLPQVTVCALSGSVYGGATDLALACDFRIGIEGMELRMPAASLGLHYYPSGLQRFVARLGLGATRRIFLLAEAVPASELLAMGYLDRLVPAARLNEEVAALTQRLGELAPLALQGMKQTIQEIAWGEDRLALWREREALTKASGDFSEGRLAFAQRRPARFQGS